MTIINRRVPNIIVPKNENSWTLFYSNNDVEGEYHVLPVPREDLAEIFKSGIINKLNNEFDVLIDEYDNEEISGVDNLGKVKNILLGILTDTEIPIILRIYIDWLLLLVNEAIRCNTGIIFYL